ncbi:unnamed protein product [Heligmosomoides polygyrus]|uniref:NADH dehydrogenase [ubiquinone] 1 beta subcomplex subunit 3 n=1 Tax=Heligmosomoides polygyrus TaxID=6339 RepID=A0A183GWE5_HELPZ|nr:unnamed protein product [Heligmosomoides polygyrus]
MGHGHEPFKIPHYSIYNNYREFPELANHEKRLAQIGLKDKWIRNYVYLFDREMPHVRGQWSHFKRLILPGWKIGVGLAVAVIAAEEGYQYMKHGLMSALEAFVNEQKKKASGSALGNAIGSASFSSFSDLRSKLSSSISALPLLSRSETADSQSLTGEHGQDGQLPNMKNRKNGGWFSSGDESFFGMSRTQRIFAFFLSLLGSMFCFSTVRCLPTFSEDLQVTLFSKNKRWRYSIPLGVTRSTSVRC